MKATLSGIKVIELADYISGPYCGMLLAGLGADVTKIERPGVGDPSRATGPFPDDDPRSEQSGLYLYLNRSKKSVTLDVETATGREIFRRLIGQADVLIESMPPRLAKRARLDYAQLRNMNTRLIVASITSFGQTGPYRDYKTYAINDSGIGGMSLTVGEAGRDPLTPPFSLGHYQTGIVAANSIMFALMARDMLDGEGQHIDVSEVEAWAIFHTGNVASAYVYGGRKRVRGGHRTPAPYPYTILPCKDGYISMIALRGGQWKPFLEVLGNGKVPDWYANDSRFKDRAEVGRKYADDMDKLLAPWLMSHTKEEIFRIAREKHIPFAPVRTIDEVVNDEHLRQRGFFSEVDCGEGRKAKCPGPPFRFSANSWTLPESAPLLGEHNHEVYVKQLGYSSEQLSNLRRMGII